MNNLKHQCHRPAFQSFSFKVDAQLLLLLLLPSTLLPPPQKKISLQTEAATSPEGSPLSFFMFSSSFIFTFLRQQTERAENNKKNKKDNKWLRSYLLFGHCVKARSCIFLCVCLVFFLEKNVSLSINHRQTVAAYGHLSQ